MATGAVSYAMYIWHVPLLRWWSDYARANGIDVLGSATLTVLSVGLPITLLVASLSYRLVELPFLDRKEAAPRTPRPSAGAEAEPATAPAAA